MIAAVNMTGGRASRLAVSGVLAFAYQDSGFEDVFTGGNLDAAEQVPAGACFGAKATATRNGSRQQLTSREGARYTITARTANAVHTYSSIGALGALIDAAYDAGALGLTVVVVK